MIGKKGEVDSQRVAISARVDPEEQRENHPMQPQLEMAKHWIAFQRMIDKRLVIHDFSLDDSVSGTIALPNDPLENGWHLGSCAVCGIAPPRFGLLPGKLPRL